MAKTIDASTRIDWIDWAKSLAIFLVVLGHLRNPIMGKLFCFHMPFFFILSGFLMKKRSFKEELKRSAHSLLIPYVIYNIYLLIYSYFTGELKPNYPLMMLIGNQWELSMACRPLWFLLSLFIMRVIYSLAGYKGSWIIALAGVVLIYIGKYTGIMKPQLNYFQVWEAFICLPFFMIGNSMKKHNWHKCLDSWKPVLKEIPLVAAFAAGVVISNMNGGVNIFRCSPGKDPMLFYISATLMAASLTILVYHLLNFRCSYIQLVSEGTLIIFALHQSMLWPLHGIMNGTLWMALAVATTAMLILSGLAWLSRKYCPILIGK